MHHEPFFLFLGEADREGVVSKLKAMGIRYVKKRLESKLDNWKKIEVILGDNSLVGVIAKLNTNTFEMMASKKYIEATERLFLLISKSPNAIFVHNSFFNPGENQALLDDDSVQEPEYPLMFWEVPESV